MESRAPLADGAIPGVTLQASNLGGYTVHLRGTYIGWIHARNNGHWKAYICNDKPFLPGICVGILPVREAIEQIVTTHCRRKSGEDLS